MTAISQTDLETCAREPIHRPGSIQPHGALLVLDPANLGVLQASRNASALLGTAIELGAPLTGAAGALGPYIRSWFDSEENFFQQITSIGDRPMHAFAHRSDDVLILEFEMVPASEPRSMERLLPRLKGFAEKLSAAADLKALSAAAAGHIRDLTGFDRVLVYRFDAEWNGHVLGEDGNGVLPSYLGLRFPASDIPAQARQLYKLNRLRIIPDADYTPVPIEPAAHPLTGRPLDLSFAVLRSVSPIHLEYMRNMGTAASMSVSVIVNGELWGLVACHSREPHHVSLTVRDVCDLAAQAFATEIAARGRAGEAASRVELAGIQARLLARMTAAADWKTGLFAHEGDLLAQVNADGAAIISEEFTQTVGAVPEPAQIGAIVDWLESRGENELYASENLAAAMPDAAGFAELASGLLAVRISGLYPSWLLWFRPEVVRTVEWAGEPHKLVREQGRIHPRNSFASWKEQVRQHAAPWSRAEMAAANDLRAAIIGIVLRRAEELAKLSTELQRSNKELEAFSYSVSHDLRAPFRHVVGYSELLREREKGLDETSRHYLGCIIDSAVAAGRLVDDLLNFSHIGRTSIAMRDLDMNKLVAEVRQSLALQVQDRNISWQIDPLPPAYGDPTLIRQVWYNLLENAVKYTRPRAEATITVTGSTAEREAAYRVEDNGVGFNMRYLDKLFGVFQRLQRAEDFEGTGIGLALARRIVERHGGRIWAEGEVDNGSSFYFALPVKEMEATDD
jgi:light-regulated signal transduction histidine kinase (bacteriophytochrome)